MDPIDAFALVDKLTTYDAMFGTPLSHNSNTGVRGLYEIPKEVDREVRAQFQHDEANKMKRQMQGLKACQVCHLPNHTAETCPSLGQYVAGVRASEEVNIGHEDYFPNGQKWRPYLPPNRNPTYNQGGSSTDAYVKDALRDISLQLGGLGKSVKGMNAHLYDIDNKLGDLDTWRRSVDKRLGDLAQEMPRPQGQLPGHPDENPRGKIAAISL